PVGCFNDFVNTGTCHPANNTCPCSQSRCHAGTHSIADCQPRYSTTAHAYSHTNTVTDTRTHTATYCYVRINFINNSDSHQPATWLELSAKWGLLLLYPAPATTSHPSRQSPLV